MSADFSERTDELAHQCRCSLRELASKIGISQAMLFAYRSGKSEPTLKAWKKLEAAEQAAGIPPLGDSVKEDQTKYELRAPTEPSIREQIAEMNRKLDALLDLFQGRSS